MKTKNFSALIMDDEEDAREIIALLLEQHFPQIEIVGKAESVADASHLLAIHGPDIVFSDIEMPDGSGFDLLERFPSHNALVIFITAYDTYAIKAIKAAAHDYVLKPVNREEFRQTVNKAIGKLERGQLERNVSTTLTNTSADVKKIAIPNLTGYDFVDIDSIIWCEATGNYTTIYFSKRPKVVVSKTLSLFENDLAKHGFCRIHHKYLVNLNQVTNFSKGKSGGNITLSDKTNLEVSARKKTILLKALSLSEN